VLDDWKWGIGSTGVIKTTNTELLKHQNGRKMKETKNKGSEKSSQSIRLRAKQAKDGSPNPKDALAVA